MYDLRILVLCYKFITDRAFSGTAQIFKIKTLKYIFCLIILSRTRNFSAIWRLHINCFVYLLNTLQKRKCLIDLGFLFAPYIIITIIIIIIIIIIINSVTYKLGLDKVRTSRALSDKDFLMH
jgi:hypothetical protein